MAPQPRQWNGAMGKRSDEMRPVHRSCPGGIRQKVRTWLRSATASSELLHHHVQSNTPRACATRYGEDVSKRNNNREAYVLNNEIYEKRDLHLRLVSVVPDQIAAQEDSDAVVQHEGNGVARRKRNREVWTCGGGFYMYNGVSEVLYY